MVDVRAWRKRGAMDLNDVQLIGCVDVDPRRRLQYAHGPGNAQVQCGRAPCHQAIARRYD